MIAVMLRPLRDFGAPPKCGLGQSKHHADNRLAGYVDLAASRPMLSAMDGRPTVLERAFALAREGATIPEIRTKLRAEGYEAVDYQFQGLEIKRQLRAAGARPAPPKPDKRRQRRNGA
jgi:hypothetical protein